MQETRNSVPDRRSHGQPSRAVGWSPAAARNIQAAFTDNRPEATRPSWIPPRSPSASPSMAPFSTFHPVAKIQVAPDAPQTAKPAQLLSAKVTVKGGVITSASMSGSAPATNLRGKRGDHSTPYVSFLHMAINNVAGKTLAVAVSNLKITLEQIKDLPGYVNADSATKKSLDAYANKWIAYAGTLAPPDASDVQTLMEAAVILRNAVPLTAFKNKVSTGGNNESNTAGGLHHAEAQVRSGNWTTQADFGGNLMVNVWDTFDFGAPGAQTNDVWAHLLNQHMQSIEASYPHIFEIKGIYSQADMQHYLVNTVLPSKFDALTAADIAGRL